MVFNLRVRITYPFVIRVPTQVWKGWKSMEFNFILFQVWKSMENGKQCMEKCSCFQTINAVRGRYYIGYKIMNESVMHIKQ